MAGEEGGMLGGLPRSRPGTRSDKRQRPADAAERAAEEAEKRGGAAAQSAAEHPQPRPAVPREQGEAGAAGNPIAGAVGAAGHLVGTGLRLATAVPRELLRRLPRP